MVKILITGFRHSGTTLLHQLIKGHPQVGFIEDEASYIESNNTVEWILKLAMTKVPDLKNYAWGEKLPWATRDTDVMGKRAIGFIGKWLKYFKGQARVLHILRHPVDTILSTGITKVEGNDWDIAITSVPVVIDYINMDERCATVVYEDLLTDPFMHLTNIFKFLGLDHKKDIVDKVIDTPVKFGKINPDRAFAFKKKNIIVDFDYEALINRVNKKL